MIHLPLVFTPASSRTAAQRHTGIHDVVDHAVGELTAVQLRAAPFHARIRRAFKEIGPIFARESHDVLHGEDQRRVDQTVDHQPMRGGINLGHAAVVTLETQTIGRDDPVEFMQRGEVDRTTPGRRSAIPRCGV